MISQLGSHAGKTITFGYDRHILPDLDSYLETLRAFGHVEIAVATDTIHYLSSARLVCRKVQGDENRVGILCCGTGMGMSIAANKFRHIYASRCLNPEDASSARTINNSNVLCLASNIGADVNREIIEAFMTTEFRGRKLDELSYITSFELEHPVANQSPLLRLAKKTA